MNLMNKIIQSKVRNKKIIFMVLICILIIGIVGLLIFNDTGNSSAKKDSKEKTSSNISNVTKENEKEDSNGVLETENKENDEDTSVISKNSLNISKKSDDSVNSDKKSDDENKNNSQKSTKSNAETNNSPQKNNFNSSNKSNKSNTSNKLNSSSSNGTNSTNNSSGSISKPPHEHVYNIPVTQKVHHDAVTKTETVTVVDQQAYDEPIYESHQVCKVCSKDFGKGENATVEAINHSVETGHSYHSTSVKVGTKHHDAITHQETKIIVVTPAHEEEKITGYRCSCGKAK